MTMSVAAVIHNYMLRSIFTHKLITIVFAFFSHLIYGLGSSDQMGGNPINESLSLKGKKVSNSLMMH